MNQFMQHLKHEMESGTEKQQIDALGMCIISMACWNEGKWIKAWLKIIERLNYDEEDCVITYMREELNEDELNRLKDLFDNVYVPSKEYKKVNK